MLVIFDCDGVLVDSEIIAAKVEAGILKKAGYEIGPEEMGHRFAGRTWPQIIAQVEEELGRSIPEELLEGAESQLDVRLAAEVKAVEGAHDALDRLDFARCVCSNSPSERLKLTMGKTGLYDRFRPYIFSAIEVRQGQGKPAPDVFLHAAETLEFEPRDTLVVEDTTTGIAGAVAAGMRVIGFTGGSHSWPGHGEALMDAGALTVVSRHADLPSTVNALAQWDSAPLNV